MPKLKDENDLSEFKVTDEGEKVKQRFSAADTEEQNAGGEVPEYLTDIEKALEQSGAEVYTPETLDAVLKDAGLTDEEIDASGVMELADDGLYKKGTVDADTLKEFTRIRIEAHRKAKGRRDAPRAVTAFDPLELYEARRTIRPEQERQTAQRVQDAYGEKYDLMMMYDSKRHVANLLHEEAAARSIREHLLQKQQRQAQQKQNKKKSRDSWER